MFKLVALVLNLAVTPTTQVGVFAVSPLFESAAACELYRADSAEELDQTIKGEVAPLGFTNVEVKTS